MKVNNKMVMKFKKTYKWTKKMVWKSKANKTKNLLSLNSIIKIWKSNNKFKIKKRNKKCHRKRKIKRKTTMIDSTNNNKSNKTNKINNKSTHKKTLVFTDNNSMKTTKISKVMQINLINKNSKSSKSSLEISNPKTKKIKGKNLKIKKKAKILMNISKTTLIISDKSNSITKNNNNNKPHQKPTLITKSTDFKEKSSEKKIGS